MSARRKHFSYTISKSLFHGDKATYHQLVQLNRSTPTARASDYWLRRSGIYGKRRAQGQVL